MKYSAQEFMEVTIDWMLLRMLGIVNKPINFIALTFFVMFLIYTITSVLPILGEGVIEVKKHMNTDVFRF
ncbi:hypothetical protein [Paenisporosarcina sp. OV554]|uniref:hypothetical protein n=1 Tax=Paenisporosarcina sp. OV554 TaxID=2135694 RepID=UPI000D3B6EE8|nr:hypothetical protein [Paenisporosarcina sp. OV554]PUB15939.1 hypothetical protein C8K15_103154 [Paenisporosarcina sp. OV554]